MTVFERDRELFQLLRPRLRFVEDGERHTRKLWSAHRVAEPPAAKAAPVADV